MTAFMTALALFLTHPAASAKQKRTRSIATLPAPSATPSPKATGSKVTSSSELENIQDAVEMLYPDEIGKDISVAVVSLANRIDSFFGDPRSDDEKNGSTLRLVPTYTFFDHKPGTFEMGVNLNLKLKNLERKAKNIEQSLREEILATAGNESPSVTGPQKKSKEEEEDWHYNFESKLAARPAIYYSGKIRIRKNFSGHFFLNHFSVSAGWDTDDSWSQKTSFFSDHGISDWLLFRLINEANWFISKKTFQTVHGPSLIHTINKYNSVSYNFRLIFGVLKNEFHHLESAYSIDYRHGTPSKRLFIDLIPTYAYPKTQAYKEVRSFEIRFEYLFGDQGT